MPANSKGWPPKRRAEQAKRIKKTKPWAKSTGPRSAEGKSRVARNGITHGTTTQAARKLRDALICQRRFIIEMEKS